MRPPQGCHSRVPTMCREAAAPTRAPPAPVLSHWAMPGGCRPQLLAFGCAGLCLPERNLPSSTDASRATLRSSVSLVARPRGGHVSLGHAGTQRMGLASVYPIQPQPGGHSPFSRWPGPATCRTGTPRSHLGKACCRELPALVFVFLSVLEDPATVVTLWPVSTAGNQRGQPGRPGGEEVEARSMPAPRAPPRPAETGHAGHVCTRTPAVLTPHTLRPT